MKKQLINLYFFSLIALPALAQVPSYVPTNGLVGYWPFNGNANDESGNGNNGTVNGATLTTDRFGVENKAYSFDGTSNYISIDDNTTLDIANVSVSAWYYAIDYGTPQQGLQGHIVSKREQPGWGASFQLALENTTAVHGIWATYTIGNNGWVAYNSNIDLTVQNWIHVVYTHDSNMAHLYINGVLTSTTPISGDLTSNNLPLWIGARPNAGANSAFFHGSLDDIGIWNRALTPQEVAALYNGCSNSLSAQPTDQSIELSAGNTAQFSVTSSAITASYQWQTNLGLGFQNLSDAGQYSGTATNTLSVNNVTLANNNQQFRCIVADGSCEDTTDIAVLTVIDDLGIEDLKPNGSKKLLKITDLNGKETPFRKNTVLLFIYEDGTLERVYEAE